ncbi:hypothetical protein CAPTEDRAFT_196955, partial [Capitella teleta]
GSLAINHIDLRALKGKIAKIFTGDKLRQPLNHEFLEDLSVRRRCALCFDDVKCVGKTRLFCDKLINYHNYNLIINTRPAELEAVLLTNPRIDDAAVIEVPDDEAENEHETTSWMLSLKASWKSFMQIATREAPRRAPSTCKICPEVIFAQGIRGLEAASLCAWLTSGKRHDNVTRN